MQELEGVLREQQKGQDFAAEGPGASTSTKPPDSDAEDPANSSNASRTPASSADSRLAANGSHVACDGGVGTQHRLGVPPQATAKKRRVSGFCGVASLCCPDKHNR